MLRFARPTRSLTATVTGSGNLASSADSSLSFSSSGTVTHVYVKAGQVVKAGQRLASIDPAAARRSLASAKAALLSAKAAYSSTAAGRSDVQAKQDEISVANAKAALTKAKAAYTTAKASSRTTVSQLADAKAAVASAQDSYELAVLQAQQNADAPTAADLAKARASLADAQAAVDDAQEALEATTLVAPHAGTVLSVSGQVGDTVGSGSGSSGSSGSDAAGGSTTSSSAFVEIADLTALEVTASVAEADAADVETGQAATVTLSATSTELAGTVTAVSVSGTTSSNVVTYPVTVTLDEVPDGVKLGASVSVSITTGSAQDALVVPTSAVTTTGNRSTVTVLENGVERTVSVEVGIEGDSGVQIVSGLSAGQTVVLADSSSSSSNGFPGLGGGGIGGGPGGGPGGAP